MEEGPVDSTVYSLSETPPPPAERRGGERHLTLLRVGLVTIGDRRELCLIRNVSAGGMSIRAYCRLEQGSRLSVELKRGEQIHGTISWVSGDQAGIAFDTPVDVVGLLSAAMDGPRPRMPRVEVCCIASVRQGAKVYGMRARDISQGGIKVESSRGLAVGGEVVVTLPGLPPQQGVVRWSDGGCYGITFNGLLALADVVAWLNAQRELLRRAS